MLSKWGQFYYYIIIEPQVCLTDMLVTVCVLQLRECELGAIVNRDLQRRIRAVSGVTLERPVLRADARLAARIAHLLDTRTRLWQADAPAPPKVPSDVSHLTYAYAYAYAC